MKPVPPSWAPADSRPSNAGILKHVLTFLGDGWVYSRTRSRSDVSPLIAAAVALHVADAELEVAGAASVAVF